MPYTPTWNNPYLQQQPIQQAHQYVPYQQMPQTQYQPQPMQPTKGTIQVSGPESAIQYGRGMPPNSQSPALFDSGGKVFYIVTTDGACTPSLETFDYSPHVEQKRSQLDGTQFVSRQEFEALVSKVDALGEQNGIHGQLQPVSTGTAAAQPAATTAKTGGFYDSDDDTGRPLGSG